MKGKSHFGYKFVLFIVLVVAIANVAAWGRRGDFDFNPDPQPDSPTVKTPDSAHQLHFPIYDNTGEPTDKNPSSIDFHDPSNIQKSVDYDPDTKQYNFNEKMGNNFLRNPTYMTMDEYLKYQSDEQEQAYWQRRLDALTLFNKKPELPQMYKEGLFDRIFGNNQIIVKPQGNVDVTFGGNWQNIKNPTLVQRAQKYGIFDFKMDMNINLLATVGDKLKLNISQNTKATFDYQNQQKLEYTGKEDEIIKKIEAGNISFPLKSNLINGVQSLFGIKTQLQFGKLWVTGVLSQQKSQRKSLTIQGGAQTQQFSIKADNYEENRDFLLAQYFHDNYNNALKNFPIINSGVIINKIELWVTNRTGTVTGVRDVLCFQDLGEHNPHYTPLTDPTGPAVPDNHSNRLYGQMLQNPGGRKQTTATGAASGLGLREEAGDFTHITARKLNTSEFSFNPQLGYIMLNTQLNSDDVLGVAYQYTYKGKVYQVGEFAEDLPPDTTNQTVLYLKLLKNISAAPSLPIWNLMMKNVYALGSLGVSKDQFILNVLYQDPGGGEKRYLPDGPNAGVPLITLLNLDRLNAQNQAQPDGIFDFIDGITINTQQGKIIFPVLEPFGRDLAPALNNNAQLENKYLYQVLYDSTRTVALQFQQNDRYIMRGTYKSSTSSEIFLGGFNIPPGSVSVTAGGTKLVENQDYQIDYGLGKLKIINSGILSSGIPINVQYEDNSTFGFQQQNFMGTRFDYYLNRKLTLGGTFMRLTERPFTQKVNFGEDPIKNTVLGLDANYQSEEPALTRLLDKLPLYSTTAPSFLNATGEVAALLPGHPKQINALDPEGSVYIDDFEGTTSAYDMKTPAIAWSLASTPAGAVNRAGATLFPESSNSDKLSYGMNRARLAWYFIEPSLVDGTNGIPAYVKNDPNQHYIRMVQQQDVFPQISTLTLQNALGTLDLGYYPKERGPYNFDATNINADGTLKNPASRWGGIMRPIDNTDFEASNVEYIQFWLMDPFIHNNGSSGGSLYINLGNVSEDVLKDSRLFFENGIPYPANPAQLNQTAWGNVPAFSQQVTRAFDNDPAARAVQDVGYDGLDDDAEKSRFQQAYLTPLQQVLGSGSPAYLQASADPSSDDYHYYRGVDYDQQNLGVLARYKRFNNPQGNSPVTDPNAAYSSAATTIPESEDINKDNTLNDAEAYYQYRIDLAPGMALASKYIINTQTSNVKLPNGTYEPETWYQFKIPVEDFDHNVGGISDFRSIRFMRMFLTGFSDSVIMRFATLELGRNQWRTYKYSLAQPGENVPTQNTANTDFSVTSVSVEENSTRQPIPYVIPPGVNRQLASVSNGQSVQLNEQALSLKVCPLQDGDARAVFKEVDVDMRQFNYLRMFIHAESEVNQPALRDGDLRAFIRIGSDFTNNYYEYQIPLTITGAGANTAELIWPTANEVNLAIQDLVNAKLARDAKQASAYLPFEVTDSKGNTILVVGNPNVGNAKNIMMGIVNPKKTSQNPNDDGMAKCAEVWFNELRMAGTNNQAGYAAAGKVGIQLADLGSVNLSGSMHTAGWGNIDQKIQQRMQDNFYQYAASTNLSLGKLLPRNWGVQLPLFVGYTQSVSMPKYDPFDQDVLLSEELNSAGSAHRRDSIKNIAQDFTSITSVNLTNVRVTGDPAKANAPRMPWSIKNFDLSFSYNDQYKHNPTISSDDLSTTKLSLGYTYSIKAKSITPFKGMIKSKSKWFNLFRDFNFNPLPSNFTFRSDMNRIVEGTQVRNTDTGSFPIPETFYKNFTWNRTYTMRWELTKSLSFDYTATNTSFINEPFGWINTGAKRDSLLRSIGSFGQNTYYSQTFNSTYTLPLAKLPATDWMNVRMGYSASYTWTAAAPVAHDLGNTIANTQTKTITGELNFTQLYNKSRYLRALNEKKKPETKGKSTTAPGGGGGPVPGGGPKNVKDLRGGRPGTNQSTGGGINTAPTPGGGLPNGTNTSNPVLPGNNTNGNVNNTSGGANGGSGYPATGGSSDPNNPQAPNGNNNNGGNANFNPNTPNPNNPVGGTGNSNNPAPPGGSNANSNAIPGGLQNGNNTSGTVNPGGNNTVPNSGNSNNGNANYGNGNGRQNGNGGNGGNNNNNNGGNGNNNGNGGGNNNGNGNIQNGGNGGVNGMSNLTDAQIDSIARVKRAQDEARERAEREKRKRDRIAARKLRRSMTPDLSTAERTIGRVLTMLQRVTINYTENSSTTLPGWMDSTHFMGINNHTMAPGLNFVYGYQPDINWLQRQAAAGRLTKDSLFNAQFQQSFAQTLNATATLQPFPDMRIELNLSKTFNKSNTALFKDTIGNTYVTLNPFETGSFNISYIAVNTMFQTSGANSSVYKQFLTNTQIISKRLGTINPYTNGLADPMNPAYKKGYGLYSEDVLIPAFIAAYSGRSASSQPLIDDHADNGNVRTNPYKYLIPLPNWRITYNGLTKLPFFQKYVTNFVINHAYTGSLSMNGFTSSLLYNDLYGLGFPSFIDSVSRNYVPFYQVPNVTIAQAFTPLIGFDATFRNNVSARFELRKSKMEALSLIDYQISDNSSTEYVVGIGYRVKGLKLPFKIAGVRKLKNELIFKMDVGLRDDRTTNNYLSNNISVVSAGQKVLRISPSVDYSINTKMQLHFFYSRQQTIPYVSSSYPITTTQGGVTFRYIFAQ